MRRKRRFVLLVVSLSVLICGLIVFWCLNSAKSGTGETCTSSDSSADFQRTHEDENSQIESQPNEETNSEVAEKSTDTADSSAKKNDCEMVSESSNAGQNADEVCSSSSSSTSSNQYNEIPSKPSDSSESAQANSPASPTGSFKKWNQSCDCNLIVINSDNKLPDNFSVNLENYGGVAVDSRIVKPLSEMFEAAAREGLSLWLSSGYRDVDLQQYLFENEVNYHKANGHPDGTAETLARQAVAVPGTSEHHTGLAVDLNGVRDDFCFTSEYKWLLKNAADYGFILRYPEEKRDITKIMFEPWHFRYVGKEHAKNMKAQNLCLEEYVQRLVRG